MKKFKSYLLAVAMISLFFVSCSNSSGSSESSDKEKDTTPETPAPKNVKFQGTGLTLLPEGTDGSAGKDATYMLLGDWPQSAKAESVTVDKDTYVDVGFFKYYLGDDDEWYVEQGKDKFFKVEPIKWRVLTEKFEHDYDNSTVEKKLLLCEIPLHYKTMFYSDFERTINNNTIHPNDYENSEIRAYLNGITYIGNNDGNPTDYHEMNTYKDKGIFQTAFSKQAQDLILTSKISSTYSPDNYATTNTKVTNDKLFLLSSDEVRIYISKEEDRIRMATPYQAAHGLCIEGEGCSWGLRGISSDTSETNYRKKCEFINKQGQIKATSPTSGFIIVPALCLY